MPLHKDHPSPSIDLIEEIVTPLPHPHHYIPTFLIKMSNILLKKLF